MCMFCVFVCVCASLGCVSGHCRLLSSIPGFYPQDTNGTPPLVTTKNVLGRCLMSPGGKIAPSREAQLYRSSPFCLLKSLPWSLTSLAFQGPPGDRQEGRAGPWGHGEGGNTKKGAQILTSETILPNFKRILKMETKEIQAKRLFRKSCWIQQRGQ